MSNTFGPKKPLFGPYTYRVKQNSNGDTLIAVYHGSKRIAHIDAFWAYSMRTIEEHEEEEARRGTRRRLVCATDLRALGAEGRYPNVLAVGHAFMDDDAYKGKGIGRAMYEAMMVEGFAVRQTRIGGQPGPMFFIPDECKGAGNTSAEAQRVWASLARDYPSQGTSIRVDAPPVIGSRAKANPRRLRNGTKAQARALIDAGTCGDFEDDNFYHVTTESRLDAISRDGLVPGKPAKFSRLEDYSAGKVFVSHGLETARIWADYIRDMVDEDEQVVVLRIRPEAKLFGKVYLDEKGTEDAGCSFYVTSTIKPQHLAVVPETTRRNPRPTSVERTDLSPRLTARRTDPALWEAVKREVTAGSKGGVRGEWSARKAQLSVALYKKRGGGYLGPKSPQNALAKWTREDWRTRSGDPSLVTGERYLPARAIAALTPAEYAATTRVKRAGMRKGEQFTAQPEGVARKTAKYRKNPDLRGSVTANLRPDTVAVVAFWSPKDSNWLRKQFADMVAARQFFAKVEQSPAARYVPSQLYVVGEE
jgi:GNAT superfamily N-acetyltransferase